MTAYNLDSGARTTWTGDAEERASLTLLAPQPAAQPRGGMPRPGGSTSRSNGLSGLPRPGIPTDAHSRSQRLAEAGNGAYVGEGSSVEDESSSYFVEGGESLESEAARVLREQAEAIRAEEEMLRNARRLADEANEAQKRAQEATKAVQRPAVVKAEIGALSGSQRAVVLREVAGSERRSGMLLGVVLALVVLVVVATIAVLAMGGGSGDGEHVAPTPAPGVLVTKTG